MQAIQIIFIIVSGYSSIPIIRGIMNAIEYKIQKARFSKTTKKFFKVTNTVFYCLVSILTIYCSNKFFNIITRIQAGGYIAVLIYTSLLAIHANNNLYQQPSETVNSFCSAFKREFTIANLNNIIAKLPLKVLINLSYLIILILTQIEELGYYAFSANLSYFCKLNKYGIVIIFAVEKIVNSVNLDKKRKKILLSTSIKNEQ